MLDTNVLMHVVNKAQGYQQIAERIDRTPTAEIGLSAIVSFELWTKVKRRGVARAKRDQLRRLLAAYRILPFDRVAALEASDVHAVLQDGGKPISMRDAMIAGHARRLNVTCVTDNLREFGRVPGLSAENWRR